MSVPNLEPVSRTKAVLFDMDGVVYIGQKPLDGVQPLLNYLEESGRQWYFVTNNSTRTPQMFADKVQQMGIQAGPEHILTSALATARWMEREYPQGGDVYVVGETGLRQALTEAGFQIIEDPFSAQFVAAAIDFNLVYEDLARATLAIRNGAKFIGTNIDGSFPSERGQIPGTGAVLALLEAASGVTPTIIGKPYPGMFEQAMNQLGSETATTMMIGDRYETDIVGAIELGMPTVAVTTGINSREELEGADPAPDYILDGLPELLKLFRQADEKSPAR